MLAAIASAIALIPGGGSAAGAAASALGYLLRCTACLKLLGVAALVGWTAWHVHSAEVARCDARLADQRQKAAAAAAQRDKDVAADLDKFFSPQIDRLKAEKRALEKKVDDEKQKKPPAVRGCKLGAAAGKLQPITPR